MDARPDELTERIRGRRIAIDNRLELLRVQLQQRDPRAQLGQQWPAVAGALAATVGAVWFWRRARQRRAGRRLRGGVTFPPSSASGPALQRRRRRAWDPWSEELWR